MNNRQTDIKREIQYIAIDTDTNKYYTGKDTYRLYKVTDIYVNILTINIAVYRELRFTNATCSLVMCLVSILNQ